MENVESVEAANALGLRGYLAMETEEADLSRSEVQFVLFVAHP